MHPDGTGVAPIADAPGIGVAGDIAWQPVPASVVTVEPTPVPTNAVVVDAFAVGQDVRSVVYGEGSVWVAASNNDGSEGGRILRIDPETHEVEAEIPVEAIPTWEVGGGAMVVAEGSVWLAGAIDTGGSFEDPEGGIDAAVISIDAATNEVAQTIELRANDVGISRSWTVSFGCWCSETRPWTTGWRSSRSTPPPATC
jgi:hypothetical protein